MSPYFPVEYEMPSSSQFRGIIAATKEPVKKGPSSRLAAVNDVVMSW